MSRRIESACLVAILALAAALRFAGLGAESLWLDEGYSVRVASGSLAGVIAGAAGDVHPPLYYLLLHGWISLFGRSEVAVRSLSALAGLGIVALGWALGRRVAGPSAGLLAALLLSLSGFQLHYAQEARSYALLGVLAALSWWLAARTVEEGRARDRIGMALVSIALVYTHHAGWFVVAAQALTPLAAPRFRGPDGARAWAGWIAAHAAIVLAWLPWLGVVRRQAATVASLSWLGPTGPRALLSALVDHADSPWLGIVIGALVVVALLGAGRAHAARRGATLPAGIVALWLAAPILLPFAISRAGRPFFLARITIAADVPLAVLAAAGLIALPGRVRLVAIGLLTILAVPPFLAYERGPHRERWREAVMELEQDARPGDRVVFDAGYCLRDVWRYYARRGDLDLQPVPALADSQAFRTVAESAVRAPRVWLVRSHDGDAGEAMARALAAGGARTLERRYESVTYQLWRPRRYLGVRVQRFERPPE